MVGLGLSGSSHQVKGLCWSPTDRTINCFSEASKALQGCNHLGFRQLLFVSNRPKLFWDHFSPQAVGHEFTLSSLGA